MLSKLIYSLPLFREFFHPIHSSFKKKISEKLRLQNRKNNDLIFLVSYFVFLKIDFIKVVITMFL